VVEAMSGAIRQQLRRAGSRRLYLAGYSGGGALAALLAQAFAGEDTVDVLGLATVAGNLDHRFWTTQQDLTPLSASLNPVERAELLSRLPQRHLVGTADETVPLGVQQRFVNRLGENHCARLVSFPLPHDGPWIAPWRESRQRPLTCP
jgi:pimeloyl-ACP methyl ester carboxylesterase